MELRKINLNDAYEQWEYTSNLPSDENGLTNDFYGVSFEKYKNEILPEDEIYLRLLKSNNASLRVMEKNGAYCVGEDEEHLFMRIRK